MFVWKNASGEMANSRPPSSSVIVSRPATSSWGTGAAKRVGAPSGALNDPPAAAGRTWYTGARLFDGTSDALREGVAVLVEDGRIAAIGRSGDATPEGARVVDVGGRTLMPGLIDAHQHATAGSKSWAKTANEAGTEEVWPGARAHVVAQVFRELLRMGFTTFRDVGGYAGLARRQRSRLVVVYVAATGAIGNWS